MALTLPAIAFGQSQAPASRRAFEVASIKPNTSGPPPAGAWTNPLAYLPGGRFTAANVTLVELIITCYPTRRIQMRGGPDWIDSDRFDVIAKADTADGEVKPEQVDLMLRTLLEDRFKLALHLETEEMTVYALAGKLPPAFRESKEGEFSSPASEHGRIVFNHAPIIALVNLTSNILHTPVIDATGIDGFYDFSVDPMQFLSPGTSGTPGPPPIYADLFVTALQEQLGFKLEKRKAHLEVTVIDHASRPTEN